MESSARSRKRLLAGAIRPETFVLAAALLAGCSRGATSEPKKPGPSRNGAIELPSGLATGKSADSLPPPADWCLLDMRPDGSIRMAKDGPILDEKQVSSLLSDAVANKAPVVLRCDRRAAWRLVSPFITKVAEAQAPMVWFCVEADKRTEVYIDYAFLKAPGERSEEFIKEFWIRVKRSGTAADPEPGIMVLDRRVESWAEMERSLHLYSRVPRATEDTVILASEGDAAFEWVLKALDLLRKDSFRRVGLLGVPPFAGIRSDIDVQEIPLDAPIEDIPLEDTPTGFPIKAGEAPAKKEIAP